MSIRVYLRFDYFQHLLTLDSIPRLLFRAKIFSFFESQTSMIHNQLDQLVGCHTLKYPRRHLASKQYSLSIRVRSSLVLTSKTQLQHCIESWNLR